MAATAVDAYLFDPDGRDHPVEPTAIRAPAAPDELLRVLVDVHDADAAERVFEALGVAPPPLAAPQTTRVRPRVQEHPDYLHLVVVALRDGDADAEAVPVDIVAGPRWVVVASPGRVAFPLALDEQVRAPEVVSRLDAAAYVAALLGAHLGAFLDAIDDVERDIEEVDRRALDEPDGVELRDLVVLRGRVARLRRVLAPHRSLLAALSQPPVTSSVERDAADSFRTLAGQLHDALGALETARQMVVGSFEVLMAQTAQRTNDVMRVLTVTSVALLPPGLVAAVASTHWELGIYASAAAFAAFVLLLATMVVLVLVVARRHDWL